MEHGRDHEAREERAARPRASNLPTDDESDLEAAMKLAGRHGVRPPEGRIGPIEGRMSAAPGTGPTGSNYAPTAQATERERERHRLERERGHVAAGTEGNERTRRDAEVGRGRLDEAAHKADRNAARDRRPR